VPTTRAILGRLSRDELLGVLDAYELAVPDRRVKDQLVEVLAASTVVCVDDILSALPRVRLKALCRGGALDDSGLREKTGAAGGVPKTLIRWRGLSPQIAEVFGHRLGLAGRLTMGCFRDATADREWAGGSGRSGMGTRGWSSSMPVLSLFENDEVLPATGILSCS
jgi:hypothetical protein